MDKWTNREPAEYYPKCVDMFGLPIIAHNSPYGAVIWKPKKEDMLFGLPNVFDKHMLVDDVVKHNCPKPHNVFLFSFVRVGLTPRLLDQVNRLSGTIGYDKLKKLMYTRGGSINANIATLKVATDIVLGKTNISKVHRSKAYIKALESVATPNGTIAMYEALIDNLVRHYDTVNTDPIGYWKGAFTESCKAPKRRSFVDMILGKSTIEHRDASEEAKERADILRSKKQAFVLRRKEARMRAEQARLAAAHSSIGNESLVGDRGQFFTNGGWAASNIPSNQQMGWGETSRPYHQYATNTAMGFPVVHEAKNSNISERLESRPVSKLFVSDEHSDRRDRDRREQREHMVGQGDPYYKDAWYESEKPLHWHLGTYTDGAFLPPYRDASKAHTDELTDGYMKIESWNQKEQKFDSSKVKNGRENMYVGPTGMSFPDLEHRVPSFGSTTGPELSYSNNFPIAFNHPSYCVCPSCTRSKREHFEDHDHKKDDCTTCKERFTESTAAAFPVTDPRFLGGAAEIHFNVGSDIREITRTYGTADQRLHRRLSRRLLNHIIDLPMAFHADRKTGALNQTLVQGLSGYRILTNHMVFTVLPVTLEILMVGAVLISRG